VIVHKNYGLPVLPKHYYGNVLVVVSSYSGNTEEALSAWQAARESSIPVAAISAGGELLELAKRDGIPYVQIPDTGIQPRSALGFSLKALLKVMGQDRIVRELGGVGQSLAVLGAEAFEDEGRELAKKLKKYIPIIYSSQQNYPIAYNWKIKFNETGKIPAFCNYFPELNHNEMESFDVVAKARELCEKFFFIFLPDKEDHPSLQRRMEILVNILRKKGFQIEVKNLEGVNVWHKIFASLLLADWTAYYTALQYGADPEKVPLVEEFKRLLT
jgi:glucose/mannose-6-phosphate isomerase